MIRFKFEDPTDSEMTNDQFATVSQIVRQGPGLDYDVEDYWFKYEDGTQEWSIVLWKIPFNEGEPKVRYHINVDGTIMDQREEKGAPPK